jgi:aminomethyltransferase
MELPFDPEYFLYNNRMSPESLNNVTPDEQYWAVRQKVIFRNTGEFPVEISGPDAIEFANYIFTRDISKINEGRCSYQFACYHDGGMITDGVMLHLNKNKLWMAQADGELFKWYLAFSNNFDVKISDPNVFVTQIQGPRSMDLLSELIDDELSWKYFDVAEVSIKGEPIIITRTGFTNELGWEFYLRPENDAELIGDHIMKIGEKYGMILAGTPGFRARRIEAGLLSANNDFTKNTTPFEVGLGKFVDLNKSDFVGKKALEKAEKKSKIWGIKVKDGIALRGNNIYISNKNIGVISSSTWSPYLECGVGIVRLDLDDIEIGTKVDVISINGEKLMAEICSLPMYDEKGLILRGIDKNIPDKPNPWFEK